MCEHEQKGVTLWFTGLPCSGKSAMADRVAEILKDRGYRVERLDGDIVRQSLTRDLGFSRGGPRREHPPRDVRGEAPDPERRLRPDLVHLAVPRDPGPRPPGDRQLPRGLYEMPPRRSASSATSRACIKKAMEGKIKEFTGISDPYEEPAASRNPARDRQGDTRSRARPKSWPRLKELGYLE